MAVVSVKYQLISKPCMYTTLNTNNFCNPSTPNVHHLNQFVNYADALFGHIAIGCIYVLKLIQVLFISDNFQRSWLRFHQQSTVLYRSDFLCRKDKLINFTANYSYL